MSMFTSVEFRPFHYILLHHADPGPCQKMRSSQHESSLTNHLHYTRMAFFISFSFFFPFFLHWSNCSSTNRPQTLNTSPTLSTNTHKPLPRSQVRPTHNHYPSNPSPVMPPPTATNHSPSPAPCQPPILWQYLVVTESHRRDSLHRCKIQKWTRRQGEV